MIITIKDNYVSVCVCLSTAGAIFDGHNSDAEMAFRRAIAHENRQADSPNVRRLEFVPLVRYVKASDSWLAEQAACALAADGVAAIFGPETAETSSEYEKLHGKRL